MKGPKEFMQGLPIHQLVQAKGAKSANGTSSASGVKTLNKKGENAEVQKSSGIEFASLLNQVNGSKEESSGSNELAQNSLKEMLSENGPKISSKEVSFDKSENSKNENSSVELALSNSNKSLDLLLNNLKGSVNSEEGEEAESQELKNNFFPKNSKNIDRRELESKKMDSPLDFIVKNAKEKNVSNITNENTESEINEKLISQLDGKFQADPKIPNQLKTQNTEANNKNANLALVSSEEFVNQKQVLDPKKAILANSELENKMSFKDGNKSDVKDLKALVANTSKNNNSSQVLNYQSGQNLLNANLIKNTKEVSPKDLKEVKELKKGKLNSLEEILGSDSKKASELVMSKETPMMAVLSKNNLNNNIGSTEAPKVLDLSKINISNTNEIIKQISDYTMQSKVAGADQIDLTVKHESIGQFNIQVNKGINQNQVDMQIMTSSTEGHKFFSENESALIKSLQQSGIQVSDLRIVTSMAESTPLMQSESKQFSSFNQNQNGSSSSQQSFQSFQSGDYRQGSEKRRDLWNEYRERYGA